MADREPTYKTQGVKLRFMVYVLGKWVSHGCWGRPITQQRAMIADITAHSGSRPRG
jgi:hypothetical protein